MPVPDGGRRAATVLHRVFGYRGVTLFPWMARVYDRDVNHKNQNRLDIQRIHSLN